MLPRLAVVIPMFGAFEFVVGAARTALAASEFTTPRVVVIDDGSPSLPKDWVQRLLRLGNVEIIHGTQNRGLLWAWNEGLRVARDLDAEYACLANSDVLFSPGWDEMLVLCAEDYALLGPVSNAPGSEKAQHVRRYLIPGISTSVLHEIALTDEPASLAWYAASLRASWGPTVIAGPVNGFCLWARTDAWWANTYDKDHVFCPRNDFDSKGRRNPTPQHTLGEYEYIRRLHANGLKSGIVPSSYVFHYRSVTRGLKHVVGDHYRSPT